MTETIQDLKKLVKEASNEAKKDAAIGTCVNPRYTFFGKRIAEHSFDKWAFSKKIAVHSDANSLPIYNIEVYKRQCRLCGFVEINEIKLGGK